MSQWFLFCIMTILTTSTDITDSSKAWSVDKLEGFRWSNEMVSRQEKYVYEVERHEYWVFNHIYNYQAERNRSDQQCSDFIFLQWCYSIHLNYWKLFEKSPMSDNVVRNSVIFDLSLCPRKMWEFYSQSLTNCWLTWWLTSFSNLSFVIKSCRNFLNL